MTEPDQIDRMNENELRDELRRLIKIIYSNDTSEWKSAAFQKIKTLEAKLTELRALVKAKDEVLAGLYGKKAKAALAEKENL